MKSGYTANTAGALLLGAGLMFVGANRFGVSRGGFSFDPGKSLRNVDFDGKSSGIVGLDIIDGYEPKFTGNLLEVSNANLQRLEMNQVFSGANPNILTPKKANTLLQAADYLADVRLVCDRGDGKFFRVYFAYALATYSLKTQGKNEGEIAITVEARLNPAGNPLDLDVAPYTIEIADVTP